MLEEPSEIYETLWNDAASAFARGEPHLDPHLSDPGKDLRRGVTLVLRPSPVVLSNVTEYLRRVARVCPEQYFYAPEQLHVTVLSIITGSESWRKEMRHLAAYRDIISDVLSRQHSFRISFRGVTASLGSVMIQGFPLCNGLARIRDELREAFARHGFGALLDRRYKISAAHMTAIRFRNPRADWKRLASLLEENRQTDFGETEVHAIQLIWGDWYASADVVRTIQEYRLRRGAE